MRKIEELLRDRAFMTKVIWIGFIFSLFLIALGLYVIVVDLFG